LAQIFVGGYDNKGHRCEVIIEIEFSELLIQKTYDESWSSLGEGKIAHCIRVRRNR